MPKFTKTLEQLRSVEEKWYYFLKHADESNEISKILSLHPEIHEAYEVLDRYHWTEGELQYYEHLIMHTADMHGTIEAAKKEGYAEGFKDGEKRKSIEIARKMLSNHFPVDQIAACTALSIQEIQTLTTVVWQTI